MSDRSTGYRVALVQLLKERDGDHCAVCKRALGDNIEIDHVRPLSKGGNNHVDNYQLAHPLCNKQKDKLTGIMRDLGIPQRRDKTIQIRVSERERDGIRVLADLAGVDVSTYLRGIALGESLEENASAGDTLTPEIGAAQRPAPTLQHSWWRRYQFQPRRLLFRSERA